MDVFAAIADPVRRDLLRALADGQRRGSSTSRRARAISRPAVSKHLRVLADAGLVVADDVGRERHYRLRAEGLARRRRPPRTSSAPRGRGPPVTAAMLDALDLEVRRVGRDRRRRPRRTRTDQHTTPTHRGDRMSTAGPAARPPDPSPSAAARTATAPPSVVIERTFRAPVEPTSGPPSPSPSGWCGGSAPGAATRHPAPCSSG